MHWLFLTKCKLIFKIYYYLKAWVSSYSTSYKLFTVTTLEDNVPLTKKRS